MNKFKFFYSVVLITTCYILGFAYFNVFTVYEQQQDVNTSYGHDYKIVDENCMKFDELVNNYCDVRYPNISRQCLDMLKRYDLSKLHVNSPKINTKVLYHTYWKPVTSSKHHIPVMKLNILSYLATQDLVNTKLIVWSHENWSTELLTDLTQTFKEYIDKDFIEFSVVNFTQLCSKGIFATRYDICTEKVTGMNLISYSDFIRFLILYTYGGIYVDGDVIFMRDLKPFRNTNFVYRWSMNENYNTAIMGLRIDHGENIEKIYEMILSRSTNMTLFLYNFHPHGVSRMVRELNGDIYNYTDLNVFNSVVFDPSFLCFDYRVCVPMKKPIIKFQDFYDISITADEFSMDDFYLGAFTYHLHLKNCGSCEIRQDSYFYHVQKYMMSKLKQLKY